MFTSNFARVRHLPAGLTPVSIARTAPRWYVGAKESLLAPDAKILRLPRAEFDAAFAEQLARLDPREIFERLGDASVLVCYEGPGYWCHRRLVAEWFESALGVVICEFGFSREVMPPYRKLPPAPAKAKRVVTEDGSGRTRRKVNLSSLTKRRDAAQGRLFDVGGDQP